MMKRPAIAMTVGGKPPAVVMLSTAKQFSPIHVGQANIYYAPNGFRFKKYRNSSRTEFFRYSEDTAVAWKGVMEQAALAANKSIFCLIRVV